MNEREIQEALLDVCNVDKSDSDFNIPRFYLLCDKLKELGAQEERERCAKVCELQEDNGGEWDVQQQCANAIRAQDNHFDATGEVCAPSATPIQWTGPDVLTLDYDGRIWPPGTKAPSHKLTVTKSEEKK